MHEYSCRMPHRNNKSVARATTTPTSASSSIFRAIFRSRTLWLCGIAGLLLVGVWSFAWVHAIDISRQSRGNNNWTNVSILRANRSDEQLAGPNTTADDKRTQSASVNTGDAERKESKKPSADRTNRSDTTPLRIFTTDEYLADLETSKEQAIFIVYPMIDFGLLCNNLHQISVGLDFAMSAPHQETNRRRIVFAFSKEIGTRLLSVLDIDFLVHSAKHASEINIPELEIGDDAPERLHDFDILFDWRIGEHNSSARKNGHKILMTKPPRYMRIQAGKFSFSLTFLLRPHPDVRKPADEMIDSFRTENPNDLIVAVHRRNFGWCTPTFKQYYPFCGDRMESVLEWKYYPNDCNITYTEDLMNRVWSEYDMGIDERSRSSSKSFAFFIASDLHDPAGDSTFHRHHRVLHIPHIENPEHEVSLELIRNKSRPGIFVKDVVKARTGFDIQWDLTMLTDMHGETKADYALGVPWSSCDRILAMWRSAYGVAASESFMSLKEKSNGASISSKLNEWRATYGKYRLRTFPAKCYKEFENPTEPLNYIVLARQWWTSEETIEMLNHPTKKTFRNLKDLYSGVEAIET